MLRVHVAAYGLVLVGALATAASQEPRTRQQADAFHRTVLTFDAHLDTPMRMPEFDIAKRHPLGIGMVDLPRMEDGGLWAAVFAIFREQGELTDEARKEAIRFGQDKLAQIERQVLANPDAAQLARSADDIESAFRKRKRAVIVGMENGYQIGLDLDNLDRFFERGVRILTLTHNSDNDMCDSSTDTKHPDDRGLSQFGGRAVERMNRLGMLIDLAHASDKTFFDVIRL